MNKFRPETLEESWDLLDELQWFIDQLEDALVDTDDGSHNELIRQCERVRKGRSP